jgi:psiF repeat-containing protein
MTRTLLTLLATTLLSLPAWAQDKDKSTAQQDKMKSCNAQASKKGMKGDERKAFMSDCLKADSKGASPAQTAQQEKMKSCNAQASKKGMKGEERKAFMSDCLSADGKGDQKMSAQQQKMKSCNAQASKKDMKGEERKAFMSKCLSG